MSNVPQLNEECTAKSLGKNGLTPFIWRACPDCGRERWVRKYTNNTALCYSCSAKRGHPLNKLPPHVIRIVPGYFKIWQECPQCHKPRWIRKTLRGVPSNRICPKCSGLNMKQSGARQAEKNGHWRGGRVETLGGYVRVYDRNHPRSHNRHIFEHILVWEQTHKQSLPIGWIIHHINGVKDDNRIENLLAMPRKNHSAGLYIKTLQERIRELEGKLQQAIIDDTCLVKE